MDTPERNKIGGTPLSKFEDSPVFNYINSLSPIEPVKSVHIAQPFHSLSFASISSIFTSPHVNSQKGSRFLIRHSSPDLSKHEFSSDNGDQSDLTGLADAVKLTGHTAVPRENCNITCSLNEAAVDPPDECATLPSNLPHSVQYDCGSPNHNTTPCYGFKTDLKLDLGGTSAALAQFVEDGLDERKGLFPTEVDLQGKHLLEQSKEEVPGCDWENLISDDADDLLIFDRCTESEEACKHVEKLGTDNADPDTSRSLKLAEDIVDDTQKTQPDISIGPCLQNATQDPPVNHSGEGGEQDEDHTPHILSGTCQNQAGMSDRNQKIGNETDDCTSLDCKVDSQQQRGMRRRCLVFDAAGISKKSLHSDSNLRPSISLPSNGKFASGDRHSVSLKAGIGSSPCVLPGIGLHLNTLATTSKDRMLTQDTLASGRRLISMPCSISPFPPPTAKQEPLNKSLTVGKELGSTCNEVLDLQVVHDDASQTPSFAGGDELSQSSPKKKRRRPENGSENDACKRCNCKKSKCLKLYCECFAAGVYCVEPCSCQGCFNKPIHEDTVLATRKQIESRNPLAFAPKVIRTSDSVHDLGEEANKTPASARHKRGCNCKKSNCLKKYCECYQGGVGCSISCRCEGCKNAFGRKDDIVPNIAGSEETEHEGEEMDACKKEVDKPDECQQTANAHKDEQQYTESMLPITPFHICRPSFKLPFFSNGKPPRSSILPVGSSSRLNTSQTLRKCEYMHPQSSFEKHFETPPEDDTPEILRGNGSPSDGVKTASPNKKRVSPPHNGIGLSPSRKGGRKLILKSIPSFPSLGTDVMNENLVNCSQSSFSSSPSS